MRLLGILWNSLENHKDEALDFIRYYGKIVDFIDIDFGSEYENFIKELYPFNLKEKWKSEWKIKGLVNKYSDNYIRLVFIDIPKCEKVFLPNKNKMMYQNVLELKVKLRKKFKAFDNKNINVAENISYNNVFHMSDDELEYENDIKIVIKYLSKFKKRVNGFLNVDNYFDKERILSERWGTRNNFWFNKNIMFKENTKETYESFSEIFNMYLMKQCKLNPPFYDLAIYQGKKGVITFNVLEEEEFMIDGSHVMSEDESFTKKELIEHNNLEMLPKIIMNWCNRKGFNYNDKIIIDLEKLFLYDLLSLQPDRNPSNYSFAINKNTKDVRLVYFDNSNMFYCDDKKAISEYKNNTLDIESYIEQMKTFLLNKASDTCFDSKYTIFEEYYSSVSSKKREYVIFLLEQMTQLKLKTLFQIIESDIQTTFPEDFKSAILDAFNMFHKKMYSIIKKYEKEEKQLILIR